MAPTQREAAAGESPDGSHAGQEHADPIPLYLRVAPDFKAWLETYARTRGRSGNSQAVYWLTRLREAVEGGADPYP